MFKYFDYRSHLSGGNRPTFSSFIALLDNFNAVNGIKETVTHEESKEEKRFIDCICETDVIKYMHKYLAVKGLIPWNMDQFKSQLWKIWFESYKRLAGIVFINVNFTYEMLIHFVQSHIP